MVGMNTQIVTSSVKKTSVFCILVTFNYGAQNSFIISHIMSNNLVF